MDDATRYLETHLPTILGLLADSDVSELEFSSDGLRLRVHRDPSAEVLVGHEFEQAEASQPQGEECTQITSPLVGVFYRSSSPGSPPFVREGSLVEDETVVGIIEALEDIPTEVEAGCAGEILQSLVDDGEPVEYGQPLFEIRSSG